MKPERETGRNHSRRTSQDFLQSWKVLPEMVRKRLEKRKESRGKALSQGFEQWSQAVTELQTNGARRVL